MKVFTEKRAENFLRKQGFDIVETSFVKNEKQLNKVKFDFPIVMKVSSDKVVHKTKVNGIKLGIKNKGEAFKAFKELMKIKNAQGVIIQRQVKGKEFLVGLKKTPEFGYVVGFGKGGSKVEKEKKVDFRVCGVKGVEKLSDNKKIQKIILKLCELSDLEIESLDINPLILEKNKLVIVDAQIVFEK